MSNQNAVNESVARKVLATVDAGLVSGLGNPKPGQMCVEAAVCYAMGLPHSDRPSCVGEAVRRFKIVLNDANWSSNAARTQGLRLLAIAQLGSEGIDQVAFAKLVAEKTIRLILPNALRDVGRLIPSHAEALETAAKRCEIEGDTVSAAESAARSAWSAWSAAESAARSAWSAWSAAWSAWSAARSAAESAARSAAESAAWSAARSARDEVLRVACQIGLDALIELKSPGCEYLYLAQEERS